AHKRSNHPAGGGGDMAGKRNRLALDVNASLALDKSPVRIDPPKKPAIVAHQLLVLVRLTGVCDLGDPGRDRPAVPVRVVHTRIADVVLGIKRHGNDLVLHQPVENLEVVSVAADEPGAYYFGLVDLL